MNRPIAAGHSRGTRQPYKRKRDAQRRDRHRKLLF